MNGHPLRCNIRLSVFVKQVSSMVVISRLARLGRFCMFGNDAISASPHTDRQYTPSYQVTENRRPGEPFLDLIGIYIYIYIGLLL